MRRVLGAFVVAAALAWSGAAHAEGAWRDGDPIPAGHHVEKTIASGITWTGAAMFGAPYALSFIVACYSHVPELLPLFIPVAGPFLQMGISYAIHGPDDGVGRKVAFTFLAVDGILQAVGLTLGLFGASLPQVKLVKDAVLQPVGPLGTPGLSMHAAF